MKKLVVSILFLIVSVSIYSDNYNFDTAYKMIENGNNVYFLITQSQDDSNIYLIVLVTYDKDTIRPELRLMRVGPNPFPPNLDVSVGAGPGTLSPVQYQFLNKEHSYMTILMDHERLMSWLPAINSYSYSWGVSVIVAGMITYTFDTKGSIDKLRVLAKKTESKLF